MWLTLQLGFSERINSWSRHCIILLYKHVTLYILLYAYARTHAHITLHIHISYTQFGLNLVRMFFTKLCLISGLNSIMC